MRTLLQSAIVACAVLALLTATVCAAQCGEGAKPYQTTAPQPPCHHKAPVESKDSPSPDCKHRAIESDRAEKVMAMATVDQLPLTLADLATVPPAVLLQGLPLLDETHSPPNRPPQSNLILRI